MIFERFHVTQKYKRLHEGGPGARCTDIGHNISRIIITINLHKLDNYLRLVFPSAMVVKNVRKALEFTGRNDSQIDSREVITKNE